MQYFRFFPSLVNDFDICLVLVDYFLTDTHRMLINHMHYLIINLSWLDILFLVFSFRVFILYSVAEDVWHPVTAIFSFCNISTFSFLWSWLQDFKLTVVLSLCSWQDVKPIQLHYWTRIFRISNTPERWKTPEAHINRISVNP